MARFSEFEGSHMIFHSRGSLPCPWLESSQFGATISSFQVWYSMPRRDILDIPRLDFGITQCCKELRSLDSSKD